MMGSRSKSHQKELKQSCREIDEKGSANRIKKVRNPMKKFIAACLIVVALNAFTTPSAMAEPITLTVVAFIGLTIGAASAAADMAYHAFMDSHKEDSSAAILKKEVRALAQNDLELAKINQEKN